MIRSCGLIVLACLLWIAYGEQEPDAGHPEKDVLHLTDATINGTLQQADRYILLELYAPWCVHCQQFQPEFAAAASELAASHLPVVLAKVDATAEKRTADWLGVKGYPTLLWFANGTRQDYGGGRTRDSITAWIHKKAGPPARTLATLEELQKAQSGAEVILAGYFTDFQGPEYQAFLTAARAVEDWPVFQTADPAVASALGVDTAPGFAIGTNFEAERAFKAVPGAGHPAFKDDATLDHQILNFLAAEQLPPFLPYSSSTNKRVFALERQVFLVGPIEKLQPGGEALQAVLEAHSMFKGKFAFATAALKTDPADMLLDFFSVDRKGAEVQVIGFHPEEQKYKLLEPLTASSLIAFCQGMLDNSYPRIYKSASVPIEPKESHVTVVVGSTFDDIVLDPAKDVLLMIYTSWSNKSKHLAVVWKKLARHVRSIQSLVIAKFEASANEHPRVTGKSYPSVWFFPASPAAEGIKFDGQPTTKELLQFVKKHATQPIHLPSKRVSSAPQEREEL